ncbi:MAG TPA: F0F1 ATP synthase subunit A [Acidimicrobiales bacterium]|jgi:F-type H+-transporting ATPase subunit a|nr:F0F1 ATP synthase subunit A [Acidimicrobiales bacterium]
MNGFPGVLATDITVGDHITRKLFGLTVNIDDLISVLVAASIVLAIGFILRAKVTSGVPGKGQLAFETVIGGIEKQVGETMGEAGKPIVPLAVTLFLFILIANELEMIPTGHTPQYLPAPTGDINFTAAMAVFVIVLVHVTWIRKQGLKHYIGHYFRPFPALFPINVIEEIAKPLTLTLRLFGNIFSGGIMLLLIAALFPAKLIVPIPLADFLWKWFDGVFVGPVQAFIFSLLTILYFGSAIAGEH